MTIRYVPLASLEKLYTISNECATIAFKGLLSDLVDADVVLRSLQRYINHLKIVALSEVSIQMLLYF